MSNNPDLPELVWEEEIELQGGEIYDFYADIRLLYCYDGNSYSIGEYKITVREKININGQETEIKLDYTHRVPEYVVEKLFEEYIVN